MRVIIAVVISLFLTACATENQSNALSNKAVRISKTDASSGKKVALIIGNKEYQKPFTTLSNTVNDAKAMKDILETRGFKVIYKTDVTKREFDNSLEEFYRELRRGAIGLLYFSGHGLESNGQNYLIPTDSNIKAKSDTQYEAIALNKITKRMQSENDRLNIVILDACRNDPFAKSLGVGGLANTEPPIGLFVSYATKAGGVSSDGRVGGNGLFTTYLIKYMKEPLSFKDVFQKAREAVYEASNKTQFPAIYDNTINVNFYFTLPRKVKPDRNKKITIVDGLMYQNHLFTQRYTWENAKNYCNNLTLSNYSDWRLSTKDELIKLGNIKLYKYDNYSNFIKWYKQNQHKRYKNSKNYYHFIRKEFVENMPKYSWFWTSEEQNSSDAWFVNFTLGTDDWKFKSNGNFLALCVR